MTADELKERFRETDFVFVATRSSGPGGQNVNKVNTRVELRFNLMDSEIFSTNEKELIIAKLRNKINLAGELIVRSQSERTQLGNKNKCIERLLRMMAAALTLKPQRIQTSPSPQSVAGRLEDKRRRSKLKETRGKKDILD